MSLVNSSARVDECLFKNAVSSIKTSLACELDRLVMIVCTVSCLIQKELSGSVVVSFSSWPDWKFLVSSSTELIKKLLKPFAISVRSVVVVFPTLNRALLLKFRADQTVYLFPSIRTSPHCVYNQPSKVLLQHAFLWPPLRDLKVMMLVLLFDFKELFRAQCLFFIRTLLCMCVGVCTFVLVCVNNLNYFRHNYLCMSLHNKLICQCSTVLLYVGLHVSYWTCFCFVPLQNWPKIIAWDLVQKTRLIFKYFTKNLN